MADLTTKPLVCVSLALPNAADCRAALAGLPCAEIRLDAMPQVTKTQVQRIFAAPGQHVATCRPGCFDDERRHELLLAAIEAGASFVDVELDGPSDLHAAILTAAGSAGCRVIVSFHDFAATPPLPDLTAIRRRCLEAGGDLAKLACQVRSRRDAARLLGLLDGDGRTIVVGMGLRGRLVRVVAPLLGSPIAYAAPAEGRSTAPGQLARAELERLMRELEHG
jgi:3-dehydroquinate dehydratase type I